MAGFLNNFDAMNLLIENGANLAVYNSASLNVYEEIIRSNNADLLECIYSHVKIYQQDRKHKK